ncbi:ATP-binding protein [Pelistega sp. NLN82]|uniref:ATP-binding protein n=1 Tax=Pelistega ratti TaxID=2652177 RepID=A0A6L9Y6B6_9BURK|nr:ATP-binding protein [Pelistega ratti]NEN75735.1 ATP-binding protein [Pelistega ratti]
MMYQELSPKASCMINSLRNIGYTLETALADILDNSLTAMASKVQIFFDYFDDDVKVAIVDNGVGMDKPTLLNAMRFGSKNPSDIRDNHDLGRFGLGLKTASFSQCKKLTVISKKENILFGAEWDLDVVQQKDKWNIKILTTEEINQSYMYDEIKDRGTLVIWENCDRLIGDNLSDIRNSIYEKFSNAEKYMSLIFHRFIPRVDILINNRMIKAIDPFGGDNLAKQIHQESFIKCGNNERIKVQAVTLPHHTKCSLSEYENNSLGDYSSHQGFYIYRNNRLVLYGTWFKLIPKRDLYKLSRVSIDLPNSFDNEWELDVKKSTITLPKHIREELKRYIEKYIEGSKRVYRSRGYVKPEEKQFRLWNAREQHGITTFEINTEHILLKELLETLDENQKDKLSQLLELIGSYLPIDQIYSLYSEQPKSIDKGIDQERIKIMLQKMLFNLSSKMSFDDMCKILKPIEPFCDYEGDWSNLYKGIEK